MQTSPYGAHEVMELHEAMSGSIDGIHTLQLYISHATDPELRHMLSHQLHFMTDEYNRMVHLINGRGAGAAVPYRVMTSVPQAVLTAHQPVMAASGARGIDDRDVSSAILGLHKASAKQRMAAALECADPEIRNALVQGAANCANQAYEVWRYMYHRGYYTLASLPESANAQLLAPFQPIPAEQEPMTTSMMPQASPAAYPETSDGVPQTGQMQPQHQQPVQPAYQQPAPAGGTAPNPHPPIVTNASAMFSSPAYREQTDGATAEPQPAMENESPPAFGSVAEQAPPVRSRKKNGNG
ncbi:spore coat protein [Brevibacillus sp. SYP-B805]|uniref:spore coat protein n=1 Tax=Brevibacillus sp. SYP-B805 TaxID=1578199 RepID=UPI0013ED2D60|nr:spore coat protein [Brevibacillus sp. SYP-B805]NGQ94478.1 spore coat protein [Brevibacillus sp. SYP-B805]